MIGQGSTNAPTNEVGPSHGKGPTRPHDMNLAGHNRTAIRTLGPPARGGLSGRYSPHIAAIESAFGSDVDFARLKGRDPGL